MDKQNNYYYFFVFRKNCSWCLKLLLLLRKLPELEKQILCIDADVTPVSNINYVPAIIDIKSNNGEGEVWESTEAFIWLMQKCNEISNTSPMYNVSEKYSTIAEKIKNMILEVQKQSHYLYSNTNNTDISSSQIKNYYNNNTLSSFTHTQQQNEINTDSSYTKFPSSRLKGKKSSIEMSEVTTNTTTSQTKPELLESKISKDFSASQYYTHTHDNNYEQPDTTTQNNNIFSFSSLTNKNLPSIFEKPKQRFKDKQITQKNIKISESDLKNFFSNIENEKQDVLQYNSHSDVPKPKYSREKSSPSF